MWEWWSIIIWIKNGKKVRSQLEIDFVANKGSSRCDIQSAFSIPDEEKRRQEAEALRRVRILSGKLWL